MCVARTLPTKLKPVLEELNHGVLVKNIGFLLQGGGEAHAMLKLNMTDLENKASLSCAGVKLIKEFVEVERNEKQTKVIKEIKPLTKILENLCEYTKDEMENLIKTFRLNHDEQDRDRRSVVGILVSSLVGTMASSVFSTIYEAITGKSDSKLIGIITKYLNTGFGNGLSLGHLYNDKTEQYSYLKYKTFFLKMFKRNS